MGHDYLTVADVLGMHTVLMQRYGGALIYAEMIQMLELGTLDIAHLDPWLRGFAAPAT